MSRQFWGQHTKAVPKVALLSFIAAGDQTFFPI